MTPRVCVPGRFARSCSPASRTGLLGSDDGGARRTSSGCVDRPLAVCSRTTTLVDVVGVSRCRWCEFRRAIPRGTPVCPQSIARRRLTRARPSRNGSVSTQRGNAIASGPGVRRRANRGIAGHLDTVFSGEHRCSHPTSRVGASSGPGSATIPCPRMVSVLQSSRAARSRAPFSNRGTRLLYSSLSVGHG